MNNPRGTFTLFKRETRRFMKVYMQTIFAPVTSNLLYFAIFGVSLHRAMPEIQGVTYLQFLVPGLIVMGLINSAYQNPSSSLIIMKYQGLIDDLMTIPLKRIEILVAFMSSAVLRAFIVGFMTYITSVFFVDMPYASIPTIFLSALLISLFFGFLGMFVGIWANEFDKAAFIQNFIMQPMIFLGGVFYSISTLPEYMQKFSELNPIVYMVNIMRYGFTGIADQSLILSFSVITAATITMGLITYTALHKGWKLQK